MDPNVLTQPFFKLLLLIVITLTHLTTTNTVFVAANSNDTLLPMSCKGSMAECDRDSEMMMDSETSRRFLQQQRYITPGTMRRDQPVCNGVAPGDPYTSGGRCVPEKSNPYHRACSRYYRCRTDT